MNERWRCLLQLGTQSTEKGTVENWSYLHNVTAREFNRFVSVLNIASVCHRRGKRCQLFSFSSKWFGNFKKSFIDKRLVNPVKYHYLSLRLLRSLFEKFENKCKNKHEVKIKLSKVQTCTTDLASYSLTQWQFWQLTLKWLSGACAQDKNKQYYCCFLFFLFLFNYAIQGRSITRLVNSVLNCTWKPIPYESGYRFLRAI